MQDTSCYVYEKKLVSFRFTNTPNSESLSCEYYECQRCHRKCIILREKKWVINFRSHLSELYVNKNSKNIVNSVLNISNYVNRSIVGKSPTDWGVIIFSPTGSLSFLLSKIVAYIRIKRNPIILFNSQLYRMIVDSESISTLSRITSIPAPIMSMISIEHLNQQSTSNSPLS